MYPQNGIIIIPVCNVCWTSWARRSIFKLNTAQFKSLPLLIQPLSGDRKIAFIVWEWKSDGSVEPQKTLWWRLSSAVALQDRSPAQSCSETNNTTLESCQLEGQACRGGEEQTR